jgi:CheY-like chemotaxis protein
LTLTILKKGGYTTDLAENGKVGLEMFVKNNYNIVLMDLQMPVMDGIQASRMIREFEEANRKKKSTIIAVTAHTKELEFSRIKEAGIDAYLQKPFNSKDLLNVIANSVKS